MRAVGSQKAAFKFIFVVVLAIFVTSVPKTVFAKNESRAFLWLGKAIPFDSSKFSTLAESRYGKDGYLRRLPLTLINGHPDRASLVFEASRMVITRTYGTQKITASFPDLQSGAVVELTEAQRLKILEALLNSQLGDRWAKAVPNDVAAEKYIRSLFPFAGRHDENIKKVFANPGSDITATIQQFKKSKQVLRNLSEVMRLTQNLQTALDIYTVYGPTGRGMRRAALGQIVESSFGRLLKGIEELTRGRWNTRAQLATRLTPHEVDDLKLNVTKLVVRALTENTKHNETEFLQKVAVDFVKHYRKSEAGLLMSLNPGYWLVSAIAKMIDSYGDVEILKHAAHLQCALLVRSQTKF